MASPRFVDDLPSSPLFPVTDSPTLSVTTGDDESLRRPNGEPGTSSPTLSAANLKSAGEAAAAGHGKDEAVDLARYLSEEERLGTFSEWPHERPSADVVAAAGFFFADGGVDAVCCPSCAEVHEGFDRGVDVWAILAHRRDCPLRPKIGETKNRSCAECHALFTTIGSKLNHCKRAHPRPEEERRRRALERQQRRVAAGRPGDGRRRRKAKSAAAAGSGVPSRRGKVATAKARLQALVLDAAAQQHLEEGEEATEGPEGGSGSGSDSDDTDVAAAGSPLGVGPCNGLGFSGAVTTMDCEPGARAGEVVMSRAEYREFRQHFRAMTDIFRDVDPRKRPAAGRF